MKVGFQFPATLLHLTYIHLNFHCFVSTENFNILKPNFSGLNDRLSLNVDFKGLLSSKCIVVGGFYDIYPI